MAAPEKSCTITTTPGLIMECLIILSPLGCSRDCCDRRRLRGLLLYTVAQVSHPAKKLTLHALLLEPLKGHELQISHIRFILSQEGRHNMSSPVRRHFDTSEKNASQHSNIRRWIPSSSILKSILRSGIGRTGTFCTVDITLHRLLTLDQADQYAAEKAVDVKRVVTSLRKQRYGMVQNPQQYFFCHQVRLVLTASCLSRRRLCITLSALVVRDTV